MLRKGGGEVYKAPHTARELACRADRQSRLFCAGYVYEYEYVAPLSPKRGWAGVDIFFYFSKFLEGKGVEFVKDARLAEAKHAILIWKVEAQSFTYQKRSMNKTNKKFGFLSWRENFWEEFCKKKRVEI